MYKALDSLMEEIYSKNDREVSEMAGVSRKTPRSESIPKMLADYLNVYHSDYRWLVKFYNNDRGEIYRTEHFRGAIRHYLNY